MLQVRLRVQFHTIDDGSRLERIRLDGGAGDVCWSGVGGQTDEQSGGGGVPVGGKETGEGRNEVDAGSGGDGGGEGVDVACRAYEAY